MSDADKTVTPALPAERYRSLLLPLSGIRLALIFAVDDLTRRGESAKPIADAMSILRDDTNELIAVLKGWAVEDYPKFEAPPEAYDA